MEVENGNNGMMMPEKSGAPITGVLGTVLGGGAIGMSILAALLGMSGRGNGGPNLAQENSALMATNAKLEANLFTSEKTSEQGEKIARLEATVAAQEKINALQTENAQLKTAAALTAQINAVAVAGVQTAGVVANLQQTVNQLVQPSIPAANIIPPPTPPTIAASNTTTSTTNG